MDKELVPGCCSCGPLLPRAGGGVGGWAEKELFLSITSQRRLSFPFSVPSRWVGELGGLQQLDTASYPEGLGCLGPLSSWRGIWGSSAITGLDVTGSPGLG